MLKTVFFNLRSSSRERMWDTAREAVRVCRPLQPDVRIQTSVSRNKIRHVPSPLKVRLRQLAFKCLPLINYQTVPHSTEADLLYMWGAFPKGSKKAFVIEMDNPFVLTYYKKWAFNLRLNKIKSGLRKAKRLTFLSETARNHALEVFGKEFTEKSIALPPFMDHNYKSNRRDKDGVVRFLFVGLGFRRKGGPELLQAFSKLPNQNARLTVIAPINERYVETYRADERITFLPPQPREKLFSDFYPTHDVFVFPSLLETLGVVVLEALSFGMGIITTNLYATPEMVRHDANGKLLPHPFLKTTKLNGSAVVDCVTPDRKKFESEYLTEDKFYQSHADGILAALVESMDKHQRWKMESEKLFNEKFSPDKWEHRLQNVLNG